MFFFYSLIFYLLFIYYYLLFLYYYFLISFINNDFAAEIENELQWALEM